MVKKLKGAERIVAVNSYVGSLRQLLLCGAGLALCMVLVQAGTGWKKGVVVKGEEDRDVVRNGVSNTRGTEDEWEEEEWEESIEQGV